MKELNKLVFRLLLTEEQKAGNWWLGLKQNIKIQKAVKAEKVCQSKVKRASIFLYGNIQKDAYAYIFYFYINNIRCDASVPVTKYLLN